MAMRTEYCGLVTEALMGQTVTLCGWVNRRRDHGGVIFIDLRDHTGLVQLVINPDQEAVFNLAESLRDEFVISATGQVRERGEGLVNPNIDSGSIEISVSELTILNQSDTLPIQPFSDAQANEELRLKYRYLDLRREQNLLLGDHAHLQFAPDAVK